MAEAHRAIKMVARRRNWARKYCCNAWSRRSRQPSVSCGATAQPHVIIGSTFSSLRSLGYFQL